MQQSLLSVDVDGKFGDFATSPRHGIIGVNNKPIIRCMFLCWFDTLAGPKIALQIPEGELSKEQFDSISAFVIPKSQLCNCVLGATIDGLTVIGCPQVVTDERYSRNEYIFNVCLCVSEDCDATTLASCEALVRKLGNYLNVLERDYGYLSQYTNPNMAHVPHQMAQSTLPGGSASTNQSQNDDSTSRYAKLGPSAIVPRHKPSAFVETGTIKWYLKFRDLLSQIYVELNNEGCSKVRVNDAMSILLRLQAGPRAFTSVARSASGSFNSSRLASSLLEVHEFDVPVLVQSISTERSRDRERESEFQSDPTVRQLLAFVNGERHVLQIALETDINLSITKACFQNLIYFGVVRLVSVFQFSNMYMCTERVDQLLAEGLNKLPFGSKPANSQTVCLHVGSSSSNGGVEAGDEDELEDDGSCKLCQLRALREELQACFKEARDVKTKAGTAMQITLDDMMNVASFFKQFVGVSVRHVCDRTDNTLLQRVDVRKLIQFGELHGILRRVHCYPLYTALLNDTAYFSMMGIERRTQEHVQTTLDTAVATTARDGEQAGTGDANPNWKVPASALVQRSAQAQNPKSPQTNQVTFASGFEKPDWYAMCDGRHHTDEIYCLYALPYNTVNDAIDQDPDLVVIWK